MTLLGAILRKVRSKESVNKKYTSPPPEIDYTLLQKKKLKKKVNKGPRIRAIVDSSSPYFNELQMYRSLPEWKRRIHNLYTDNTRILFAITNTYLSGGKVDSHWTEMAPQRKQYYTNRAHKYEKINRENKEIYKLITKTRPRVVPTSVLEKEWSLNKHTIIHTAKNPFILFPVRRRETFEDVAFEPPDGVQRPRAYITLQMRNAAIIGTIVVELFTDVCPATCRLFLELLDGDGLGHGYVGTQFFR
ncbi:unnamed protein product [Euphydryas editha]|uniref:PPIase cyclophilin-type domain-containing protein n=1 Tax=Euphydryas editha TaxID=104508 RepID=A0AAU9US13_EUPED|nr:unnamed protein product [Euphydryas editha]